LATLVWKKAPMNATMEMAPVRTTRRPMPPIARNAASERPRCTTSVPIAM